MVAAEPLPLSSSSRIRDQQARSSVGSWGWAQAGTTAASAAAAPAAGKVLRALGGCPSRRIVQEQIGPAPLGACAPEAHQPRAGANFNWHDIPIGGRKDCRRRRNIPPGQKGPSPPTAGVPAHFFELSVAPWFSMALSDPQSYPQLPCTPMDNHGSLPGALVALAGGWRGRLAVRSVQAGGRILPRNTRPASLPNGQPVAAEVQGRQPAPTGPSAKAHPTSFPRKRPRLGVRLLEGST
jgi:hypothetical protein